METMTSHKFIAMMLVCGVLAPFESDAQSVCMTLAESDLRVPVARALVSDYCFGFDFDEHLRVDEGGDLDHRRGGADGGEEFAVGAADFFPA